MKGLTRLSGQSLGLRVVRFVLGIGSAALLTRLMSLHDYGVYAYTLVIATLLAIPGEAGMPNLVMREIARARVDGDMPRVRGIVRFANLTVLLLTLAMAAIAGLVLWLAQDRIPEVFRWTLAIVFPAILFGALANTRAGILRALGSPMLAQIPEQIVRPAAIIVFALAAWAIVGGQIDPLMGIIGYVGASSCAFLLGTVLLTRSYRAAVGPGPVQSQTRAWLGALLPFSAIAGMQVALVQVSAFVLGLTAAPSEVATFRIATLGSDFALFSTYAINSLISPQLATYLHQGDKVALQLLIARVNRLNVAFALAVTLGIALFGQLGLRLVFGPQYAAAFWPMLIVSIGHLVGVSMGYAAAIANMAGRERLTMIAAAGGFALNATLSVILCQRFGALGAAAAAAITAVTWRLGLSLYLKHALGIRAWAFSRDFSSLMLHLRNSPLGALIGRNQSDR